MFTFKEIKELIDGFVTTPSEQEKLQIRDVAQQLGYDVPDCKCKDKFADLVIKLKIWLKQHPTDFCHYDMKRGVVRRYKDGTNVYNLNLTDEKAEWLLENDPEAQNYLTKIISTENVSNEPTVSKSTEPEQELVASEPIEKPKRKRASKVKK